MTRMTVGPGDPWRGFTPRESHQIIDPEAFKADTYKGAVWRFADVGHPVEAILEFIGVSALIVGVVVGFPLLGATILLVVVIGLAWWNHGHAIAWTEQHNARVEAALALGGVSPAPSAKVAPSSRAKREQRKTNGRGR